jgi:hypothetical protein
MDATEKLLLGSILLMLFLYITAIPFAQYYDSLEDLSFKNQEGSLVAGIQMTASVGLLIILVIFLMAHRINKYKPIREWI